MIDAPELPLGSSRAWAPSTPRSWALSFEGNIALIRTMLRLSKYRDATTARARDRHVFNVIMAYLVYSEIEEDNLVGVAWGKAQGLPPEQLPEYIVIPRSD